jgi:uncharacterized protein (TIGR02246 family)
MRTSRIVTSAGIALALVCGWAMVSSAADEADAEGVRKSCEAIVTAWNKHDAKAIAAVFAEDADMVAPDGKLHSGRAAIEKAFTEDHTGAMSQTTLYVLKEPVRFPTADVAVSDAEVEVRDMVGPDGKKSTAKLIVTNVWKKADGKWWVYASRPHILMPAPAAK